MLVDDDGDILSSYGRLLERRLGAKVLRASSGMEALRMLDGQQVDFFLSDYRMPEMDGIQFLAITRATYPLAKRAIFTAFAEPTLVTRAKKEADVDDFFSKDGDPEVIVQRVRKMLGLSAA